MTSCNNSATSFKMTINSWGSRWQQVSHSQHRWNRSWLRKIRCSSLLVRRLNRSNTLAIRREVWARSLPWNVSSLSSSVLSFKASWHCKQMRLGCFVGRSSCRGSRVQKWLNRCVRSCSIDRIRWMRWDGWWRCRKWRLLRSCRCWVICSSEPWF